MSQWTLFSNHGHVLLFLATDPEARLRDVAAAVGITERAVQKIVRDLCDGGILSIRKHGRRNRYRVHARKPLRHDLHRHRTVGQLLRLMTADSEPPRSGAGRQKAPAAQSTAPGQPSSAAASVPGPTPDSLPARDPASASAPQGTHRPAHAAKGVRQTVPQPGPEPESRPVPQAREPARPRKRSRKKATPDGQQGSLF